MVIVAVGSPHVQLMSPGDRDESSPSITYLAVMADGSHGLGTEQMPSKPSLLTSSPFPLAAAWLREFLRALALWAGVLARSSLSSPPALFHCTTFAPSELRVSRPALEDFPSSAMSYKSPTNSTGSDSRRWEMSGVCMLRRIPPCLG
jgi:hypothetical protein